MKKLFQFTLALVVMTLTAFTLGASELPSYAPKDTDVILFANLNRIANSRLLQKIFEQNPELQQMREKFVQEVKKESGLNWEDMINSEVCFFTNIDEMQKAPVFQALAISNSGKAEYFFDYVVKETLNSEGEKPFIGKRNGVRAICDDEVALLLLDSRMLQFSLKPEAMDKVIDVPLTKTNIALASDIDTGAMLSIAVDITSIELPAEIKNDEMFKDLVNNLEKITVSFSEKGEQFTIHAVATYRDKESAAVAFAADQKITQAMKQSLAQMAEQNPDVKPLLKVLEDAKDELDGKNIEGNLAIDSDLVIQFFAMMMANIGK